MKRIYLMKNDERNIYFRTLKSTMELPMGSFAFNYRSKRDFSYYVTIDPKRNNHKPYIVVTHSNLLMNKKKSYARIKEIHQERICSLSYNIILQPQKSI